MSKDDSLFRYYKGERENPFDQEKQNTQYQFWGYEELFEMKFNEDDFRSHIWIPTNTPDIEEWQNILNTNPVDKEELFKLWLFNLVMVHLPEKYQSTDNSFLRLYYDTKV